MSSTPADNLRKSSSGFRLADKSPKALLAGTRSKGSSRSGNKNNEASRDTERHGREKDSIVSDSCRKRRPRARTEQQWLKQQDGISIVVTNTGHERMRKVSVLTIDEDDYSGQPRRSTSMLSNDSEGKHTLNTAFTGQTENEAMVTRTSRSSPLEEEEKKVLSATEMATKKTQKEAAEPTSLNTTSKSQSKKSNRKNKPGREFSFPSALISEDSDRRHRTQSLTTDECLVEVETDILESSAKQKCKLGNPSLDGVQDDSSDESQKAVLLTRRGMEVRGFIAPTTKQRQLMRKVSGLGMEDPVFGKVAGQLEPKHASNIFEDMALDDVPEDMRDMVTFISDRTDSVDLDDDILDSTIDSQEDQSEPNKNIVSSLRAKSNLHNSCSSLPPLGLDPRSLQLPNNASPHRSPVKKFASSPPPPPPPQDTSVKSKKLSRKSTYEAPRPPSYTPPAGSFVRKKVSKKGSRVDAANVMNRDDRLAAKVDAMFQKSMSTLEFPSNGRQRCLSPFQSNSQSPSQNRRRSMGDDSHKVVSPAQNQDRRMSTNSVFVPPEMPTIGQRSDPFRHEERRMLPSMATLFPDTVANPPVSGIAQRKSGLRGDSRERSMTPDRHGLPPCCSPPLPNRHSKKQIPANVLPPSAAHPSNRKPKASYCVKAKRRDTASTTDMSPNSSLDTDSKWSYPENPVG
ncbi:hypothetical protein IV203_030024 [Nitzschia inconspicua]|uniref:Uncharacterized protein n=1 Tax=Nitzschia inconspicua TaxID=303405 RepID=A0A9K3LST0_9STRA|nr:hypothetical protein IV203_030024 [Nitzschia inconspicua]